MVQGIFHHTMSVSSPEVLEQKLAAVKSIHDIQQVLESEGLQLSEVDVVKGLIADGVSPRFAGLSETMQAQLAQVLVLAEREPAIAEALVMPEQLTAVLPPLLAAHGLTLDAEVLAALSQPHDLNDQQLQEVVGGVDPVLAGLITLGITTLGGVLMHWINRHYDSKKTA